MRTNVNLRAVLQPALAVILVIPFGRVAGQSDSAAIVRVLNDQVQAWNDGDIEGYMQGYWRSDATMFVSGGNVLRGYDEVLARYKKTYASREAMGTLLFEDLDVRLLSASTTVVTGSWRLLRSKDSPGGRFTLIFQRNPEGWRIVYDHTSSEPAFP